MILVIVYYYMLLTLEEMVGSANTSDCITSGSLTWPSSKNYTKDGRANFYFDYDFFQICSVRIDADFTLLNTVFQPNLTLSENGVILNVSALHRLSSNNIKNHANAFMLNYGTERLFDCPNCSVSVKFGDKNASDSKNIKRIAIRSVSRAISVHPMEGRVVKDPQLYFGVGALIIIGLFILMLLIIRKSRGDKKPSEALASQARNSLDEPTYATIDISQGDGNEEHEYAICKSHRNQFEELYVYTSSTSPPNRPRKEDNEGIYSQVEIVNLPNNNKIETPLEYAVYAKPNKKRAKECSAADEVIHTN